MAEVSIGSVFAGYRIEGVAGEGGMGRVYRATQMRLNRPVALKLIVPELAGDPDFRARFERESHLSASIDHPNVIPIYEAGEADGTLFIAMRWVEGTDLRSLIVSEARLDPGRVVAIVEQVGEALDAAHSGGLVHRDVKPANVMLTATHGREHAYLTDFGLTKKTEATKALTRTGHFVGTPDYMSPEQITGAPADARADVYALGCLMYHALTGRPPYDRDSEVATMYAHLNDPPPSAVETTPGTPVALDAVIARALAKEAARRYPSAGDLGRASRAAIGGPDPSQPERSLATGPAAPQVTEITPPPPPPPATPPEAPPGERPRRRALPLALAALVGLAAVGGLLAASGVLSGDGESSSEDNGSPAAGESPAETTPKAVATIPAGNGPDGIAVDGNTVWVSNSVGDTLTRLDTKTNKQIGEPVPVGRNPDGVAVADGAVWVANTDDGTVNRVAAGAEPGITATVPVESGPESLSIGGALLWVANGNSDSVSRIDRASATSAGSPVSVGNKPIGLFAGEENVWVTNSFSGTVTRIDPSSGEVIGEPVRVGKNIRSVIVGLGSAWVSSVDEDTVTRLDPSSGAVVGEPITVGDRPKEMAVAGGSIWVVNEGSNSVSRIDPKAGRVVGPPIAVGTRPVGIAAGAGSLWVSNNASDTVTRINP